MTSKCYRMRRYFLYLGAACAAGFAATGIFSTLAALWNIDGSFPRPGLFALVFGLFWSVPTMGSIWLIVASLRDRLSLGDGEIVQQGVLWLRTVRLEDIHRVRWRLWPEGGSVVVHAPTARIAVYFGNFTREDRREIIEFLRKSIAEDIQENWSPFDELTATGTSGASP